MTTTPTVTTSNRYGAPAVRSPRDLRALSNDPCRLLLSSAQLRGLGYRRAGELQVLITGYRACNWEDRTTKQTLTLVPYPNRNLLADAYRTRLFVIFQPTTIANMPAVREQSDPGSNVCTITVGISNDQGLELTYIQLEVAAGEVPDDPCGRGERIAEVVIGNLPPLR